MHVPVSYTHLAANFYKASIVNYKGYANGEKQEDKNRYSEIISSALLSKNLLQSWKELAPVRPNHFDTAHTPSEKVEMEKMCIRDSPMGIERL